MNGIAGLPAKHCRLTGRRQVCSCRSVLILASAGQMKPHRHVVLHPAVLRAVHRIIEAAYTGDKPVTICGEAASDPRVACLPVGLGVRRLSMSPLSAAHVRYAVRKSHLTALEELAHAALKSASAQTVSVLGSDALPGIYPELRPEAVTVQRSGREPLFHPAAGRHRAGQSVRRTPHGELPRSAPFCNSVQRLPVTGIDCSKIHTALPGKRLSDIQNGILD